MPDEIAAVLSWHATCCSMACGGIVPVYHVTQASCYFVLGLLWCCLAVPPSMTRPSAVLLLCTRHAVVHTC